MAAYSEVFKRIEKKYKVQPCQRTAVETALGDHLQPDAFGRTLIISVYWDTSELSLISRSLEKPKYKEKVRVRAYGEAAGEALVRACVAGEVDVRDGGQLVFLELKKKFKRVVYKRRIGLSLAALFAFLGGCTYEQAVADFPSGNLEANDLAQTALNRQIARELAAVFVRHANMTPSFAIRCERTAWAPLESTAETDPYAQLRVTFDDSLCFCNLRASNEPRHSAHAGSLRSGLAASGRDDVLVEACAATSSRPEREARSGEIPCRMADCVQVWTPILEPSLAIMELKNAGPLPAEFARTLSKHDIFPTSFSKYGTAYQMTALQSGRVPGLACVFGRVAAGEGVGLSSAAEQLDVRRPVFRPLKCNLFRKKGERCA